MKNAARICLGLEVAILSSSESKGLDLTAMVAESQRGNAVKQ